MLNWNFELATALRRELRDAPGVADVWAGWASEIAADTFAFAHVGYAAVAALHDVIAGEPENVFALRPMDPHPVAYLRVLLGTQMCVRFYGAGPWDDLAQAWTRAHPISEAPAGLRELPRRLGRAAATHRGRVPAAADGGVRRARPSRRSSTRLGSVPTHSPGSCARRARPSSYRRI